MDLVTVYMLLFYPTF